MAILLAQMADKKRLRMHKVWYIFAPLSPGGRQVFMMGVSHMRFAGNRIFEEWMIFDELGVLVQAYRK